MSERTNTLAADLHTQTAEDEHATMIVVNRDDLEELIAVVGRISDWADVLFLQLIDACDDELPIGVASNHAHMVAKAESLLAKMAVSDE